MHPYLTKIAGHFIFSDANKSPRQKQLTRQPVTNPQHHEQQAIYFNLLAELISTMNKSQQCEIS